MAEQKKTIIVLNFGSKDSAWADSLNESAYVKEAGLFAFINVNLVVSQDTDAAAHVKAIIDSVFQEIGKNFDMTLEVEYLINLPGLNILAALVERELSKKLIDKNYHLLNVFRDSANNYRIALY